MTSTAPISPAFASALDADRDRYNSLFLQARRDAPQVEAGAFFELLRRADSLSAIVAGAAPPQTPAVVSSLYTTLLEMLRKGLAGPVERHPGFEQLWSGLLAGVFAAIPNEAAGLVAPLTNGLFNLAATRGCRAKEWVGRMRAVAGICREPKQLLAAGQVAAWRCGMAPYRESALRLARELPPAFVAHVLLSADSDVDIPALLQQLEQNPWAQLPGAARPAGVQLVAEIGSFRGLGGEFRRPPRVAAQEDHLYVTDGVDRWLLIADTFGAILHRVRHDSGRHAKSGSYKIDATGIIHGPRQTGAFPLLAGASSSASNATTLAVTLPHSHRVFLLAETECRATA